MINQKVLMRFLEQIGLEADVVANGEEAITAVQTRAYDVILMDVSMPIMGGMEAAAWMRHHLPSEKQPYIVSMYASENELSEAIVSGNGEDAPQQVALEPISTNHAHFDNHIDKPVKLADLTRVLERYQQTTEAETIPEVLPERLN